MAASVRKVVPVSIREDLDLEPFNIQSREFKVARTIFDLKTLFTAIRSDIVAVLMIVLN